MRKANSKDRDLVVDILVSAFKSNKDDSSINYIVKQDAKRLERMKVLMGYLFDKALVSGEVLITDNENGCLLIKYSDREETTLKRLLKNIHLIVDCIGIDRIHKVVKQQYLLKKNHPQGPYIKPMILGIKEEYIGKGIAARLMMEVLRINKENNLPVVIDVASEKNVELYKKLNFKVYNVDDSLGFPLYFLRLN